MLKKVLPDCHLDFDYVHVKMCVLMRYFSRNLKMMRFAPHGNISGITHVRFKNVCHQETNSTEWVKCAIRKLRGLASLDYTSGDGHRNAYKSMNPDILNSQEIKSNFSSMQNFILVLLVTEHV